MFDQKKYYSYTNDIKFNIGLIISINTILITILALLVAVQSIIISIGIILFGIYLTKSQIKGLEIKLQQMYWHLDMYNKIANQSQRVYNIQLKPSKNKFFSKERRKIKQVEILDENKKLDYTLIPNYKAHEKFITNNEVKFFKALISVVTRIRNEHHVNLSIFTQVALNRIIEVNNGRNEELWNNICDKSIDFVLYDLDKEKIHCCIELNDETHLQEKRKLRDKMVQKALKDSNIGILFIKREDGKYDENGIIRKILSFQKQTQEV